MLRLLILKFLLKNVELCLPGGSKCITNNCYVVPPSPPSYAIAPMLSMPPMNAPPPPPSYSMIPSYRTPFKGPSSVMMGSQIPFLSALDPPIPPISSSAFPSIPQSIDNYAKLDNKYELSAPESPRWDRQEPEYKHVDEVVEAVVAPDVIVADTVDEKSTDSESVEKVHDNERLARMDLKYEEPEPTPFENGTVTFHAWFLRKF